MSETALIEQVSGSGFFGGGSTGGQEAPNTARSRAFLEATFLLAQGQIAGFPTGDDVRKHIYFDKTPLMRPDGQFNFNNVWVDYRPGFPTQTPMIAANRGIGTPTSINQEVSNAVPVVRTIAPNPEANIIRVTIVTPGFRSIDDAGNISGVSVNFRILLATNGGAFVEVYSDRFDFKTAGGFARDYNIGVTAGDSWQIRVERTTADATSSSVQDKIIWQSYTTIVKQLLRYPNWALLSVRFDAAYFSNTPKIALKLRGKITRVPSNYDPDTRTYTGFWDGTWILGASQDTVWIDSPPVISVVVDNESIDVNMMPQGSNLLIF